MGKTTEFEGDAFMIPAGGAHDPAFGVEAGQANDPLFGLGDALADELGHDLSPERSKEYVTKMPPNEPPSASDPFVVAELKKKAELYRERNKVYGDNYKRFGPILSLMLEGRTLDTSSTHDMNRLGILVQVVAKMTRYGENFNRGGHADSLDDIAVYAMMLRELDQ